MTEHLLTRITDLLESYATIYRPKKHGSSDQCFRVEIDDSHRCCDKKCMMDKIGGELGGNLLGETCLPLCGSGFCDDLWWVLLL